MNDALGIRMKSQYEDRYRAMLPRRTYTILRIDGRAFHTYTKDCEKPYDDALHAAMVEAAVSLCDDAQGCQLSYVQSDEASFLLTDFASITTGAWFDGNVQKITSVAASVFTSRFGWNRYLQRKGAHATFDCRVFTIPDPVEVENYFVWRNKDAIRNSILALAQSLFPHKELQGKSQTDCYRMVEEAGSSWEAQPLAARFGSIVVRKEALGGLDPATNESVIRHRWDGENAWEFTTARERLGSLVPRYPA